MNDFAHDDAWHAGTLGCGQLIMHLNKRLRALSPGQVLRLTAEDSGAIEDLPAWCRLTGHHLQHAAHPIYFIKRKED